MSNSTNRGSIGAAIGWMVILEILLFWLPVFGSLIAGFVGGRKAGGLGRAVAAVFLPGIIFGVALFLFATLFAAMPLVGVLAGFGGFAFAIAHVGPLLLGAIAGGLSA